MAKVVLVGYGKMLCSLIDGITNSNHEILGVFRCDRTRYTPFQLFFKDIFNQSKDFSIIKSKKLYDIKGTSVNGERFFKEIQKLNPDMIIVGSWGEKFRSGILNLVPCVNFHPALLPRNRGANPYFWSIYLDQTITGLTIHYMNEKFDQGDIILQEAITIDENETGSTLREKTARLAKGMVVDLLNLFDKKQIQPIKQNEEFASYQKQISEKDVIINLNQSKKDVYRHLRALYPWTTPYVKVGRRYIKVNNYEFLDINDENINRETYSVISNNKNYFILKGSNFLIKVHK